MVEEGRIGGEGVEAEAEAEAEAKMLDDVGGWGEKGKRWEKGEYERREWSRRREKIRWEREDVRKQEFVGERRKGTIFIYFI